ncbi:MAG: lipopolysaccharide biosynthesis protein [Flavobacterium sp.]
MSAFYKGISGLSLFFSIPVLINYLGDANYGVWVLIFTLFQLILLMDFGLASTLKTKIPELQHYGNTSQINAYIKSTYISTAIIAAGTLLLLSCLVLLLDLQELFKIALPATFITKLFILNIIFFCVNFVMNTHKALFVSVHRGKYSEQSIAVNQLSFLISLLTALYFFSDSDIFTRLYIVSVINGVTCLLVNCIYTLYFFKTEPFSLFTKERAERGFLRDVFSMGLQYMAIQVGTLFVFSSDNYILAYFFGPEEVVPYEIVNRYFQFPLMILMAAMAPIWSLFTKHYLQQDKLWFLSAFKKFNLFFLVILCGLAAGVLIAKPVMKLWIGSSFNAPLILVVAMAVFTALRIFSTYYGYFFNGIGNLKTYLLLLYISVLLKIPLCYIFIKNGFGVVSVLLASIVCLAAWSIIQPAEAYKIVRKL